jgi:hypothetical protein
MHFNDPRLEILEWIQHLLHDFVLDIDRRSRLSGE